MVLRILVLDDDLSHGPIYRLEEEGVELDMTTLSHEETTAGVDYAVSQRGIGLARRAADFDIVIIGNNMYTGYQYARAIPDSMKSRTLIVWNKYTPGDERPYAELGFADFTSRQEETVWLLRQAQEAADRAEA
jgi:hypothetical protein